MVNSEGGQLYTIEGFAAGLIMIMTAYLVVSATSVYTAGDTHISDMQLEQLGSDALKIMDTPVSTGENSALQKIIEIPVGVNNETFRSMFLNLTNNRTELGGDHIQFTANYTCRIYDGTAIDNGTAIESNLVSYSRNLTGGEHAIRVTKWVMVNPPRILPAKFCGTSNQYRAVLVEVLMWRD